MVRETYDNDRAMDQPGFVGHPWVPAAKVQELGVGRKTECGHRAHSSWCLGCGRPQAQLILNTDSSPILDVCMTVYLPPHFPSGVSVGSRGSVVNVEEFCKRLSE